jgi:hypothetical protein
LLLLLLGSIVMFGGGDGKEGNDAIVPAGAYF